MKAYKFRFESVLKSKKIIVDELAAKTARAHRILLLETRRLDELKQRQTECVHELAFRQIGSVDAAEVYRCHRYLELLTEALAEQETRIEEVEKRVDMLRNMLIEAEKDRKILEKLDEKDRASFYEGASKKEQAVLDEIGVNRFVQRATHGRVHSRRS